MILVIAICRILHPLDLVAGLTEHYPRQSADRAET
jgi:hypothetical protein